MKVEQNIKKVLVDKRNFDQLFDEIVSKVKASNLIGIDTETHNENAHQGIKEFNNTGTSRSFDWRRITVTGLSIYPHTTDEPVAYYFNFNHADVENRLDFHNTVKKVLDAKPDNAMWISHKAPFEIVVLNSDFSYRLKDVVCTLQMAVSAYGPDEYPHQLYIDNRLGAMQELFMDAERLFKDFDSSGGRENLNPKQSELLSKALGKTSKAKYSYNGMTEDISYGYGLKKAVHSFFGFKMATYEETLGDKKHMGELTGPETVDYGADDAYWAVMLFIRLYSYMKDNCPEAIKTFFEQENPMVQIFSDVTIDGMKVNTKAIENKRDEERKEFAKTLRELKAVIKKLLPFNTNLNEKLAKYDKWYATKADIYRKRLEDWANLPDCDDDFEQVCQVSSPVSNAWAGAKCTGISIAHYYQARLMMYDLTRIPAIVYKGKISSDSEARGEVRDILKKKIAEETNELVLTHWKTSDELLKLMGDLASIEQRMKLYLTPYLQLTDPDTGRMYPELSSQLATRRMSCSNPNAQQLAKRGESSYVRGFFEADETDHVLLSIDWSQIELVLIGEFSGDPEFFKAYGQLPYEDLHIGTTVDVLNVMIPELTMDMFKNSNKMDAKDLPAPFLIKPNGEPLDPKKAKKFWRTEVGKGSNFNYWYSGALATVGEKLGWTSEQMWAATEAYRKRFAVAENWRVQTIEQCKDVGFIQLPDGHRRVRWEATHEWVNITRRIFEAYGENGFTGVLKFGEQVMRGVRSRACNQLINALIQGTCATLAKRSIIKINPEIKARGLRAKFKMAIHDEVLYSVHRDDVVAFIKMAKEIMKSHTDIIKTLKIDATASIGKTFEPWNDKNQFTCQIELDEAPSILDFEEGIKLNDQQIQRVIDEHIFRKAA